MPVMDFGQMFAGMVCSSKGQPAVIRFRWNGDAYGALGASKQRPGSVIPANGNGPVRAAFNVTPDYTGCPHCGADNFVRCGRCQELSCYDTSWEIFHCPRCGNSGQVTGTIDSVSGLGSS
jgi:hypothetical protein